MVHNCQYISVYIRLFTAPLATRIPSGGVSLLTLGTHFRPFFVTNFGSIFVVVFSHSALAFGATLFLIFLTFGSRRCTPKPPVLGVSTMDTGVVRAWAVASATRQPSTTLFHLREPPAISVASERSNTAAAWHNLSLHSSRGSLTLAAYTLDAEKTRQSLTYHAR